MGDGARVLVVDDAESIRATVSATLELETYRFETAETGLDAFQRVEAGGPGGGLDGHEDAPNGRVCALRSWLGLFGMKKLLPFPFPRNSGASTLARAVNLQLVALLGVYRTARSGTRRWRCFGGSKSNFTRNGIPPLNRFSHERTCMPMHVSR